MTYLQSSDKTAYAKEAANVSGQMKQLHKNPKGKLKNHFLIHLLLTIVMIGFFIGLMVFAKFVLSITGRI